MGNASGTVPNIELDIPKAMLSIPTVEVADLFQQQLNLQRYQVTQYLQVMDR